jgi:hypothetical protein
LELQVLAAFNEATPTSFVELSSALVSVKFAEMFVCPRKRARESKKKRVNARANQQRKTK